MIFRTSWLKMGGWDKMGEGATYSNKLILTFGGFYVCANFVGKTRSRNAKMTVCTYGHAQTQNGFIICAMLYAMAVGQNDNKALISKTVAYCRPELRGFLSA